MISLTFKEATCIASVEIDSIWGIFLLRQTSLSKSSKDGWNKTNCGFYA